MKASIPLVMLSNAKVEFDTDVDKTADQLQLVVGVSDEFLD